MASITIQSVLVLSSCLNAWGRSCRQKCLHHTFRAHVWTLFADYCLLTSDHFTPTSLYDRRIHSHAGQTCLH
jgi:hypothetical protein